MRALIVVHYFAPHIGGMEVVAQRQAESLRDKGHEVTILTCRPDMRTPLQEIQDGITIKRVRSLNFIENKWGVTFPIISPFVFLWLLRNIRSYDIVHIHDVFYMSSHFAAIAAMLRRHKYFITQHVALVDHTSKLVMAVQKLVYRTIGKLLFMNAQLIVNNNVNVRQFLLDLGIPSQRILLKYNGIDMRGYAPPAQGEKQALRNKYRLPLDKPIVLFVGRLVPKKGYDLVAHAHSSDYLTLIVGNGHIPVHMRRIPDVHFFGPARSSQLQDLYRVSDVFVFPAVGEIFTLVMQEAMACGVPVITTNDEGYASYDLDPSGILLVDRNVDAIRTAIRRVLDSPARQRSMANYSRKLAARSFSWSTNYETEYSIYKQAGITA